MMNLNQKRRDAALAKELLVVEKQEKKMQQAALKAKPAAWKTELESRIPEKVYTGLESAFCKGFGLVFDQGRAIIEKGYNKEDLQADHAILDFAVQLKGGRKELKKMHRSAKQSDLLNLAVTTVEGVGLGALGVGMQDIVLFLGTLLKGVCRTSDILRVRLPTAIPVGSLLVLTVAPSGMAPAWLPAICVSCGPSIRSA